MALLPPFPISFLLLLPVHPWPKLEEVLHRLHTVLFLFLTKHCARTGTVRSEVAHAVRTCLSRCPPEPLSVPSPTLHCTQQGAATSQVEWLERRWSHASGYCAAADSGERPRIDFPGHHYSATLSLWPAAWFQMNRSPSASPATHASEGAKEARPPCSS